jgi:uncharacterized protein (DUF58 family)
VIVTVKAAAPSFVRRLRERWHRRRRPEGIRMTKVGLWFVLFTVLIAIAATNTGNNSLYLVVAVMLGTLVVSGLVSRGNVDRLVARLTAPSEIYARSPLALEFEVQNGSRLLSRWLLLLGLQGQAAPRLVTHLPPKAVSRGQIETMFPRRGRHRVPALHVWSLFPFGFFRKGTRYPVDLEVLVYPELYAGSSELLDVSARYGDEAVRRPGRGGDLHSLRPFLTGDDPRNIHWKRSARTGQMVFQERTAEESRRLSVILDNAAATKPTDADRERFERLVSEAATVAVDHLARGFEVELVTRDERLGFAIGRRQRVALLESLALVEPTAPSGGFEPLQPGDPAAALARFVLEASA